ncbi:MAG: transcriptional regulator [Chloroflexi bacterium RBG_16_57_11]|nr:MAG: transcriptional regulator [Chloroflexi bacterium RBG_16_57_11]
MDYNCELTQKEAQPVLSIRSRSVVQAMPELMGRCFGSVAKYLGELGEAPAGMPFAAFYNMDMNDLDVEIGFPVGRALPGRGEVQPSEIPGGWQATLFFTGRYDAMTPAYQALTEFVKASGHEPTGVAYEMYLNDPSGLSPEQAQTLIMFPLKS